MTRTIEQGVRALAIRKLLSAAVQLEGWSPLVQLAAAQTLLEACYKLIEGGEGNANS